MGELYPEPEFNPVILTVALYGTSVVKILTNASSASFGFFVGGNLSEYLNVVSGLKTFPAVLAGGKPSAPTTDNCAFQILLR